MKFLVLFMLVSPAIFAANFSIVGPCHKEPMFETTVEDVQEQTVMEVTNRVILKYSLPAQVSEYGVISFFDSPTGWDAYEIIDDKNMRAYGWCYEVDGENPEILAGGFVLHSDEDIEWFFGYAEYKNGKWVSQCEKAHKLRPAFLCK